MMSGLWLHNCSHNAQRSTHNAQRTTHNTQRTHVTTVNTGRFAQLHLFKEKHGNKDLTPQQIRRISWFCSHPEGSALLLVFTHTSQCLRLGQWEKTFTDSSAFFFYYFSPWWLLFVNKLLERYQQMMNGDHLLNTFLKNDFAWFELLSRTKRHVVFIRKFHVVTVIFYFLFFLLSFKIKDKPHFRPDRCRKQTNK